MESRDLNDLDEQIVSLSHLTLDYGSLEDMVRRVTDVAVKTLSGCDFAGVSLVNNGKVTTAAATADIVVDVDAVQYATQEGPCLQAIREDRVFLIASMEGEERFPGWASRAHAAGIESSLSLPLKVKGETIGALNLYSGSIDGFSIDDQPLAEVLADHAAVSLLNGQIYDRSVRLSDQLQTALGSRTVIGQATGLVMCRENLAPEAAFDLIKTASQDSNVKLRDVAQQLVARHVRTLTEES